MRPLAGYKTKSTMEQWAADTRSLIIGKSTGTGPSWQIKSHNSILVEMIGAWKKVVFFIKTDWEGEIQNVPITFMFKVEGMFHISRMYKAHVTIIPEVINDRELRETTTTIQDAIIDKTMEMDMFMRTLSAKTPEELQKRVVEVVPGVIDDALSCSVAIAITLPHLRKDFPSS